MKRNLMDELKEGMDALAERRNTNTTRSILVEYLHKLLEDSGNGGNIVAGLTIRTTSTPSKLKTYTAYDGTGFIEISPEKIQVLQRTTTTIIEVVPVDQS